MGSEMCIRDSTCAMRHSVSISVQHRFVLVWFPVECKKTFRLLHSAADANLERPLLHLLAVAQQESVVERMDSMLQWA